jgi:hypothetical protein
MIANNIYIRLLIFVFFLSIPTSLMSENIYRLATRVAKTKEVKDIIRQERKLFATIRRYYLDIGNWPEDSENGDYGSLNEYLLSDVGVTITNKIHGRILNYSIDTENKIITISGGEVDLDVNQLEIYRARVEARDSDRNATYLFEKLERNGLVGAQKKYIVLPTPPENNQKTNYPDGTIGYSYYTFDSEIRWRKYIVRTIDIDGEISRVWIEENL